MSRTDYWEEALEYAFDGCGLHDVLMSNTAPEQRKSIAESLEISAENQGQAFYTPSSGDRHAQIEREWRARYEQLQKEFERYQSGAESAMSTALRLHRDTGVTITSRGEVFLNDGRTTQVI